MCRGWTQLVVEFLGQGQGKGWGWVLRGHKLLALSLPSAPAHRPLPLTPLTPYTLHPPTPPPPSGHGPEVCDEDTGQV